MGIQKVRMVEFVGYLPGLLIWPDLWVLQGTGSNQQTAQDWPKILVWHQRVASVISAQKSNFEPFLNYSDNPFFTCLLLVRERRQFSEVSFQTERLWSKEIGSEWPNSFQSWSFPRSQTWKKEKKPGLKRVKPFPGKSTFQIPVKL